MDRFIYDIGHLAHRAGHIGRIQTVSVIPVKAGESIELNLQGVCRLAPNRKEIVSDCQWDIIAFHVPHRILLGTDFVNIIKSGTGTINLGFNVDAAYRTADYLCVPEFGSAINKLLPLGYNSIWYNYFAIPASVDNPDNILANNVLTWFPTNETGAANCRKYGRLAARLPHVLNGYTVTNANGVAGWEAQSVTAADYTLDVSGGSLDIKSLAQQMGIYKSKQQRAWLSHFYQDILEKDFGGRATRDADTTNLRPELLMRQSGLLSGTDIDGTDDATLGSFQGKTLDRISFNMPRRYFGEHGFVWIMMLCRYPLVHEREIHPLLKATTLDYDNWAGNADKIAKTPPVNFDPSRWLYSGSTYNPDIDVQEPYGQHYRFQNNVVHSNFRNNRIPGYPFSNFNGTLSRDWGYYQDAEYEPTFRTPQIGQWQLQSVLRGYKFTDIPPVMSSIMAGTN